jgi:integrating conjugative element protein (TIGR03759 family)
LEIELAARELAWAQTYKEAVREIAQGKLRILPFDMTPYDPYHYTPIAWQPQDKLIVLLSVDTPFKGTIDTIIDNMEREKTLTLDLFFIDNSVSRETLNAWAASHNIPKLLINQKRITLNNNDNNQYESLKKYREKDSKLPIILLKRNGQIQTVSTSLF